MRRAGGLLLIVVLTLGLSPAGSQASPSTSKPIIGKDATFSPGSTLHADGTIDLTKGGYKARVDGNGKVTVVAPNAPEQPFGRIAGDQLLMASGHTGVRVDGKKLIEFADGKDTAVIGVIDPPSMKRTALVMTAAFFIDMAIVTR